MVTDVISASFIHLSCIICSKDHEDVDDMVIATLNVSLKHPLGSLDTAEVS